MKKLKDFLGEASKPASNAKNYTRKGGNGKQVEWLITFKDGKTKKVIADSRENAISRLSTDQKISGGYKVKKIKETE